MGNKPFRALLSMLALTVILTVLYAGDKKKPSPVSRINAEAFSMAAANLRITDLVYRINHEPQYASLSPAEKVRVITRAVRQDKARRGIHSPDPKPDPKANARSRKLKM